MTPRLLARAVWLPTSKTPTSKAGAVSQRRRLDIPERYSRLIGSHPEADLASGKVDDYFKPPADKTTAYLP
mgnify:CR=1 FL=1